MRRPAKWRRSRRAETFSLFVTNARLAAGVFVCGRGADPAAENPGLLMPINALAFVGPFHCNMGGLWWSNPMTTGRRSISETIKYGILAGAAGGVAELAWVSLYAVVSGGNAAILARGVTTAAGVSAILPASPVAMGIAVHMVLAVVLGVALAGLWQAAARSYTMGSRYTVMFAALTAVWATNFFVLLPVLSPDFVHLVPYAVSLTSKLLFALAAAETLRRCLVVELGLPASVRVRQIGTTRRPTA
jgi:hypothetical protein